MSWLSSLFGRDEGQSPPQQAPAVAPQNFAERVRHEAFALEGLVKRSSGKLSPEVYSLLRSIDDLIKPVIDDSAITPLMAEDEYAVEAYLTDYIPTPLNIYLELPAAQRAFGGKADLLLQDQYVTLLHGARSLRREVETDNTNALEAHAIFLQNKFNA